jgi:hypothetical protein
MNSVRIIPSSQEFKSAPSVDQKIDVVLEQQSQNMVEYDRTANLSLAQVYDDERQSSVIFRPTFKISYYYKITSYIIFKRFNIILQSSL